MKMSPGNYRVRKVVQGEYGVSCPGKGVTLGQQAQNTLEKELQHKSDGVQAPEQR